MLRVFFSYYRGNRYYRIRSRRKRAIAKKEWWANIAATPPTSQRGISLRLCFFFSKKWLLNPDLFVWNFMEIDQFLMKYLINYFSLMFLIVQPKSQIGKFTLPIIWSLPLFASIFLLKSALPGKIGFGSPWTFSLTFHFSLGYDHPTHIRLKVKRLFIWNLVITE